MTAGASGYVLVFRVGPNYCAVPAERVHEIVHTATLVLAPGQPSILEGFLNLRGRAVPVVRTRQLFGLDPVRSHPYTPLIILDCEGLLLALKADSVEEVNEVYSSDIRPLGENHSLNDCAEGLFTLDGRDVVVLSCRLLLLAKEKETLRELQAATQQRLSALGPAAG
jgi:purine-binding chemotaxis protein CheW